MKKGIRGHDVIAAGLCNISKVCEKNNIEYLQLVLERSIEDFKFGQFSKEYAMKIKNQLGKSKVAILGSYINPSSTDEEALKNDLEKFKEKIRYASILKPSAVGTETGIYEEGKTFTEEAYQYLLKNIKELVSFAKEYDVTIGIEGVQCFVINTPKKLARLIDDIDSDNIKAIFDPVNYLNIDNYIEQDKIISDSFDLFGDKMVVIHAKDFVIKDKKLISVIPGEGLLNYKLIFKKMKELNIDIPIICEGLNEDKSLIAFENLERIRRNL